MEEYGYKFMKGKNSKAVFEEGKKLRKVLRSKVIKGDIYDPEALIDWGGMKSYIPTNFYEHRDVQVEYYYFVMETGQKVDNHIHPHNDEVFFILGGEGILGLNGKEFKLRKGIIHHMLAGQWHSLDTTKSKKDLEIFIIVSPPISIINREDGCEGFNEEDWEKMGYGK